MVLNHSLLQTLTAILGNQYNIEKNKRFHPVFHAFYLIEKYLNFLLLVILD